MARTDAHPARPRAEEPCVTPIISVRPGFIIIIILLVVVVLGGLGLGFFQDFRRRSCKSLVSLETQETLYGKEI